MGNLMYVHRVQIFRGTEGGAFETFIVGDVTMDLVVESIRDYYTKNSMMVQGNNVDNLIKILGECGIPEMDRPNSRYARGESVYKVSGVRVGKVKIKRLVAFGN